MLAHAIVLPMLALAGSPDRPGTNLALRATASASESYRDLTPEKANDGAPQTRWSGIPGHNQGVWYQLDWPEPVRIGEVVLAQYDTFVMELDVQVRDATGEGWRTLRHLGEPGAKLPKIVVVSFDPVRTTALRIGNITNGPSFNEVEVYESARLHLPEIALASDCDGGFVGTVTDEWGASPAGGAAVTLTGDSESAPWKRSTTTDEHGMFFAPMPVAMRGDVTVAARVGDAEARRTVAAAGLQYGLTPPGAQLDPTDLGGSWRFRADPPEGFWQPEFGDGDWPAIQVPAHWEMQGFRSLDGVGGYRRAFRGLGGGGRTRLRFDGVYSGAEVWVNGELCATHEGGATPFEVDVTRLVRQGENVLAVRVREHTVVSDELDKMSQYADFPLAGIMRPVTLFRVPDVHIAAVRVETRMAPGYVDATLRLRVALVNQGSETIEGGTLGAALRGPTGERVDAEASVTDLRLAPGERREVPTDIAVRSVRKWDAEHPNLYDLALDLSSTGSETHRLHVPVGFRQVEIDGPRILVNGTPVKFRGTCHHDSHPLLGRAVTEEIERRDLTLIKEANLNAVRTSHYPPHPSLPGIADELGLYVEDEASFCWAGVSDDLRLTPRIVQLTAELLARDRNHPSVFMWSLCNESQFGYGFQRSHEWVRRADPTRPTAAATSAWLEIATLHNPLATSRIKENESLDKPLLFDESIAPFQGIWGDRVEAWADPGVRDYYVAPFPAVWRALMASRSTQGSFIWAWADDVFAVPGRGLEVGRGVGISHLIQESYRVPDRGLVGDAPWGVIDSWGRRKPEFWHVKKLHSPVKIAEGPLTPPAEGQPVVVPVENQYDFTDLAELRIEWRVGEEFGVLSGVAVPPHTSGELRISMPKPPRRGDALELRFGDAAGRLVDTYRLPFGVPRVVLPSHSTAGGAPLRIVDEATLAGRFARVVGSDFEVAFERDTGLMKRGVAFGHALLAVGPTLRLVPSGDPLTQVPSLETWQPESCTVEPEGSNVRVRVTGRYESLAGAYDTLITPGGEITVTARFDYSGGPRVLRGAGLAFAMPRECDLLRWQRRGEWSVYPDDHIGRPLGEARAVVQHPASVPPTWPWAEDNSPLGTNDFRSTKRDIEWAALSYPDGPGVLVVSDGTQSARVTLGTDRVTMVVTDGYGGTSAGLWEWTHNYGSGKTIDKGAVIESTLRLRLVRFGREP